MNWAELIDRYGLWVVFVAYLIFEKWDSIMTFLGRRQASAEKDADLEREARISARLQNGATKEWLIEWLRGQYEGAQSDVKQANLAMLDQRVATEKMMGEFIEGMELFAGISRAQSERITEAINAQTEAVRESTKVSAALWFAVTNQQKVNGDDITALITDAEDRLASTGEQ